MVSDLVLPSEAAKVYTEAGFWLDLDSEQLIGYLLLC